MDIHSVMYTLCIHCSITHAVIYLEIALLIYTLSSFFFSNIFYMQTIIQISLADLQSKTLCIMPENLLTHTNTPFLLKITGTKLNLHIYHSNKWIDLI